MKIEKYKYFLLLLVFLSSGNINCSYLVSGGDTLNKGNIEGIVKDAETKDTIAGVTVKIDTIASISGVNGIYSIRNAGVGDRLITAEKSGYQLYSDTVNVLSGNTSTHNIQMLKAKASHNPS